MSVAAISPRTALVTDGGSVLASVVDQLTDADVSVRVLEPGATPAQAVEAAADASVVIIGHLSFGPREISELSSTGLLIRAGIGVDVIDVDAATDAGIWVANVPDFCVDEVADHTMMLLAAAMRRLPEALSEWRSQGKWNVTVDLPVVHRIRGKRLGLIGLGRIGRQVAQRARSFGFEVVAYDPYATSDGGSESVVAVSLEELLATSDAISLHCPLTPETHHVVNDSSLNAMQTGVVLVNTSRGGLVDLGALDRALESGKVSVAALDVLEDEPYPDLDLPLLKRSNVMVTSHVAWWSVDASAELARATAAEALRFLAGERPLNLLNPQARQG